MRLEAPVGDARRNDAVELVLDFSDARPSWAGAIDDRVMGGVSESRLRATAAGTAAFEG